MSNSNFIRTPQHFFSNLEKHRGHSHKTFSCQIKIFSLCHFFTIRGLHDPFYMIFFSKTVVLLFIGLKLFFLHAAGNTQQSAQN